MLLPCAHLHVHSAFSFLDSSASVRDVVLRAAELGQPMIALTDSHSITGIPSFVKACIKASIKPIGGCTVEIDGGELVLLADGPAGWASLCQILTAAGLKDVKRQGLAVTWEDLENTVQVCFAYQVRTHAVGSQIFCERAAMNRLRIMPIAARKSLGSAIITLNLPARCGKVSRRFPASFWNWRNS